MGVYRGGKRQETFSSYFAKRLDMFFSKMVPVPNLQALSCRAYRIYKRISCHVMSHVTEYTSILLYSYIMYRPTRETLQVYIKTLKGLYEAKSPF